jgi:hypothetical protein
VHWELGPKLPLAQQQGVHWELEPHPQPGQEPTV